jgi:hypothetical protein
VIGPIDCCYRKKFWIETGGRGASLLVRARRWTGGFGSPGGLPGRR